MRQIFLDTETTGLSSANGDRIVEIGCVEMLGRRRSGNNRHFYLNPERDSDEGALKVHGLTTEFLSDKPKFAQVVDDLLAYLQGAEIIIHNASFDVLFLDSELSRAGKPLLRQCVVSIVDSLALAKEQFPGKRNSLDGLCDRFEIDRSSRTFHGALLDAELLTDVYINLTRGQDGLLMDEVVASPTQLGVQRVDASRFHLLVQSASEAELAEHEAVLAALQKDSKGKCLWLVSDSTTSLVAA